MNIKIVCVGKLKEKYFKDGIAEYVKRMSRFAKVKIVQVPDEKAPEKLSPAEMEQEKEWKTAHWQDSQAVEVCHGEVLEAKLRGTEAEGEKSQPQVGGVHP